MKTKTLKEANKLNYKMESLDLDITRLRETNGESLTSWLPVHNVPTEIAEAFRVNLLEYLCKQKEVLAERLRML